MIGIDLRDKIGSLVHDEIFAHVLKLVVQIIDIYSIHEFTWFLLQAIFKTSSRRYHYEAEEKRKQNECMIKKAQNMQKNVYFCAYFVPFELGT